MRVEDDDVVRAQQAELLRFESRDVETFAIATVSNAGLSCANTSPPAPPRCEARTANSFSPPPAGSRPTPASTRPM